MYIEILGITMANKGSELLLAAIVDRFRAQPKLKFVAPPPIGNYAARARHGLYQTFDARAAGRLGLLVELLLGAGYRKRYGLVHPRSIDAVLDASGFLLGDQWPAEWIKGKAKDYQRRKVNGQTIVLLPQAFGPFTKADVAEAARDVFRAADLIFARDDESYAHASALIPGLTSLHQAPDFTNLLDPRPASRHTLGERPAAIVPNTKVLEFSNSANQRAYRNFLLRMAHHLRDSGLAPFVLVHETAADLQLAEEVATAANVQCIIESDALVLKGLAARCHIMVGSRYHGLVNALSQGVPALGVSWSHKYEALFADYERRNWLIEPSATADAESLTKKIIANFNDERVHLMQCSTSLKGKSEQMWRRVEEALIGAESIRSRPHHR